MDKTEKVVHKKILRVLGNKIKMLLYLGFGLIYTRTASRLSLYSISPFSAHTIPVTSKYRVCEQHNADSAENQYVGLWEPLTRNELKQFIGLSLLMGIVYKPTVSLYWPNRRTVFNTDIFTNNTSWSFSIDIKILTF